MMTKNRIYKLTLTALLIAIGILIPLISPFKIMLEPASFTLASHVATMFAMFLSPTIAIAVAVGTALGFFLGGFPIVITLRALSHVIFASAGAYYLKHYPHFLDRTGQRWFFNFILGVLHALCEVVVVFFFYFGGQLTADWTLSTVFLLVGVGTVIHSMIDFIISYWLYHALPTSLHNRL